MPKICSTDDAFAYGIKIATHAKRTEIVKALNQPAIKIINLLRNRAAQLEEREELDEFAEEIAAKHLSNSNWGIF